MSIKTLAMMACLITPISGAALAQAAAPAKIRGTIAAVDATDVSIATHDGSTVKLGLTDKTEIAAVKKAGLGDIKPGTFIGTAAQPGQGGDLDALEIVVFPEAMRGVGEGHYDWDLTPTSSMTNANVDAVVEGTAGPDLRLSYKGGNIKIHVPPYVPIVTPVPATAADLKPGSSVFAVARKQPDGSFQAMFIATGKDGVVPPM